MFEGGHPFWSADGKELFYNSGIFETSVVSITTRPSFAFGAAARIPTGLRTRSPSPTGAPRAIDITRDGKIIGVIGADQTQSGTRAASQIQVVLNWFEELKQRVGTK